jgi:hypothetical protein
MLLTSFRSTSSSRVSSQKKRGRNRSHYGLLVAAIALSYMFIYKQGEYLMLIHSIRACYINLNFFQHASMATLAPTFLPKIYVQWPLRLDMIYKERYPGIQFSIENEGANKILAPVHEWLRVHHEYLAGTYLLHRLYHDRRLSTNNLSEADLCYPSCAHVSGTYERYDAQILQFQVKPGKSAIFDGCHALTIGIETLMTSCSFSVPYWHSIYYPGKQTTWKPWNTAARTKFLCYVGGTIRGIGRENVIDTLYVHYYTTAREQLFFNDTIGPTGLRPDNLQQLFEHAWEMYASSIFSWQPEGDTETRRGFYDSWMFGCIPVISRSAACTYGGLFGGTIFAAPRPSLEHVVIVLEDAAMYDATSIMTHLRAISLEEITLRRQRMAELAPLMQWGWDAENGGQLDAFTAALNVFMQKR